MKDMLPLTSFGKLVNQAGEVAKVKYLNGKPRQYIFDASKGLLRMKDQTTITKAGESFKYAPIGFRIFRDAILGMKEMTWFESFFLNAKNQVCSVLFHGYSVDELYRSVIEELYYEDLQLTDVILEVTPVEKRKKDSGEKYFIANFSMKPLTTKEAEALKLSTQGLQLWRDDTITTNRPSFQLSHNYSKESAEVKATEIASNVEAVLEG